MLFKRHIVPTLYEMSKNFPVLLITGQRQIGKSSLLINEFSDIPYLTFDDYILLDLVNNDVMNFFKENEPPLILDEVQYVPKIFRAIKLQVDKRQIAGQYFLTGSQQFELMQNVSESLAGRIGILTLNGLSSREINEDSFSMPFLPTDEYINERKKTSHAQKPIDIDALWTQIHRGSMPRLCANKNENWLQYYSSYVKTYIERDVRMLTQVGDELTFMKFLISVAARTGEQLNMAALSNDVGVSQPTIKRWLSVLRASNIIYLLEPFSNNITSRIVKTPKLYFLDTGLVAYLCKWLTSETLKNGAMSGNIFETFVIGEIIKSYTNKGQEPPLFYYRDADKREVDVIIYQNGTLYPLEIKKTSSPNLKDIKHFDTLKRSTTLPVGNGGLICTYDKAFPLSKTDKIIPLSFI